MPEALHVTLIYEPLCVTEQDAPMPEAWHENFSSGAMVPSTSTERTMWLRFALSCASFPFHSRDVMSPLDDSTAIRMKTHKQFVRDGVHTGEDETSAGVDLNAGSARGIPERCKRRSDKHGEREEPVCERAKPKHADVPSGSEIKLRGVDVDLATSSRRSAAAVISSQIGTPEASPASAKSAVLIGETNQQRLK